MLTEFDVKRIAKDLEIPMVGITDAAPFSEFLSVLKKRAFTPFCHIVPEKRLDIRSFFPEAQTVIVIGLPYTLTEDNAFKKSPKWVSSFCRGEDYHVRVTRALTVMAERLREIQPDIRTKIYVDNAKTVDRLAAWRAGLGFFGKNNMLIHPQYGSAFFIGQLVTDAEIDFQKKSPLSSRCGGCECCLRACPNQVLDEDQKMDTARCISYLTQKKELLSEEAVLIKNSVYGCDACQTACPYNQKRMKTVEPDEDFPNLDALCDMDDALFDEFFKETAMYWRGASVLRRNARLVKKNR